MRISTLKSAFTGCIKAAAVLTVLSSPAFADGHFDASKNMAVPGAELDYQKVNDAISMAAAYGDRSVGAHGSFGRFIANFETPQHIHTNAYHGVVIKGEMTNPFAGESRNPHMGPGSYWYVPARAVHSTACISDTPCEFYFHADGPFDFQVVEQ